MNIKLIPQAKQLKHSKVLIVGLGGLGSPVAMYLAASGVGHLVLVDGDCVDLSNLQRQIIHETVHIGQQKTVSAQRKLQQQVSDIHLSLISHALSKHMLKNMLCDIDVVVDCSDNFATRFALNAACVEQKTPLVSGAAVRWGGQVAVFLPEQKQSPCYRCLYPDIEEQLETCSHVGILAPIVGIIGSIQAVEVVKVLLNIGTSLCGKLLTFDAYTDTWRTLKLHKDPACPVCS